MAVTEYSWCCSSSPNALPVGMYPCGAERWKLLVPQRCYTGLLWCWCTRLTSLADWVGTTMCRTIGYFGSLSLNALSKLAVCRPTMYELYAFHKLKYSFIIILLWWNYSLHTIDPTRGGARHYSVWQNKEQFDCPLNCGYYRFLPRVVSYR